MVKALETSFKRIEKKYVLDKEKLGAIWDDLKEHLVEDDYPTSTIPSLLSVIIFLVNGSLGTSVAVAGTFCLVRFRSAAGGARELLAPFLTMTIGLSTGMGCLTLAILTTIVFLVI